MALPTKQKRDPRPIAVTVRLSETTAHRLKALAEEHNLSQADVVEHLVNEEFDNKKRPKKQ